MDLRCLLFSSDEGTAAPILQVLAGLGLTGEHCPEAAAAVDKVTRESFQIVILDWDCQPESEQLLAATRQRKASERPLTLAIVSDDASVPKALQAGANSILRKPLLVNQVTDTLTTARDLLRAKRESAAAVAQAAAAGASSSSTSSIAPATVATTIPISVEPAPGQEKTLRAGEFLVSAPSRPGGQFVTDSDAADYLQPSSGEPIIPLTDLEPTASAVASAPVEHKLAPASLPQSPSSDEPRGLQWYLKTRAASMPQAAAAAPAPAPVPAPHTNPELLGFDQIPYAPPVPASPDNSSHQRQTLEGRLKAVEPPKQPSEPEQKPEQKKQPLFSSYAAEASSEETSEPDRAPSPQLRLGKGTLILALFLAGCAILAAPQAPWHQRLHPLFVRGQQALHAWLNPQVVTTPQAPMPHEDFARAGDEYKLPAPESIPDATTDPSQIHVVPVIDPTAKKPGNPEGANAGLPADQSTPASAVPSGQAPASTVPAPASDATHPDSAPAAGGTSASPAPTQPAPSQPASSQPTSTQPSSTQPASNQPASTQPASTPSSGPAAAPVASPPSSLLTPISSMPAQPVPQKSSPTPYTPPSGPSNVPSSLKSQMASMAPDAGGNKPPEAAMQSIEPVQVPEAAERALLTDQPTIAYPANATGQAGTVTLQVLVGRDGTVQDAKFLQGSLAFARTAIEGVKQWKFKPYSMNGRPVSVQTLLTIGFKPAK
jgi:TonB family protein